MSVVVPRTCTTIPEGDPQRSGGGSSRPLEEFRSTPAYVLLGDPGSGKSTAFETEYEAHRGDACLVSARDARTFSPDRHPEWRGKTLFVDGLDEVRAGSPDARTPLDDIRRLLDELGKPRFRLSCREADWLGATDRRRLTDLYPEPGVTLLRLDPLTSSDIVRILESRPEVDDAEDFIASAHAHGVHGLLANPMTLDLLARVVAQGGQWPQGRRETFDAACREMAREHNEEHSLAGPLAPQAVPPDAGELLDAAGRLCAFLLISGFAGYTLRPDRAGDDYPFPARCPHEGPEWPRVALATKLFRAVAGSEGRFTPVHRHVAEFLAARHLARLIGDGLPVLRVLALITGEDGIVVTVHRGLSAWLAVHCATARHHIIERDPVGVVLYGDIREFSAMEKRTLLATLSQETSRIDPAFGAASAFGPLVTSNTEEEIRRILLDPRRDLDHQRFLAFILRVLDYGSPLPNLAETLFRIVRDGTWLPDIAKLALDAFLHHRDPGDRSGITGELEQLLADIRSGALPDPDRDMLGTLLSRLYPDELPPSRIWDYLSEPNRGSPVFGRYFRFWQSRLMEGSSDDQIATLLDTLSARLDALRPAIEGHHLQALPVELLARGLEASGDDRDTEQLCDWLKVGVSAGAPTRARVRQASARVRDWLAQRPERHKAVIKEALARWAELDGSRHGQSRVARYLYGASPPADFGKWCLEEAVAAAERNNSRTARYLLERAVEALSERRHDAGLSLEDLEEGARGQNLLRDMLPSLLVCRLDEDYFSYRRATGSYEREYQRERQAWVEQVRSSEPALRGNRASPRLLYKLANVYFGYEIDAEGDDPIARIGHFLFGNRRLIDAALRALRATIDRNDVPGVEQILRLSRRNQLPLLALPYLAGLAEFERTSSDEVPEFDKDRMSKALLFLYSFRLEERPEWYGRLLVSQPEFVAELLVRFVATRLQGNVEHIVPLHDLVGGGDHARVARFASLPLLRAFPLRAGAQQMEALGCLLWTALKHADRESLEKLIAGKLSRTSMNPGQRVRWLAAGVAASPEVYLDRLAAFVEEGRPSRTRTLAEFLAQFDLSPFLSADTGVPALRLFIRLLGASFGPGEARVSRSVERLIQRLAALARRAAGDALADLVSDEALAHWRDVLVRAQDRQRVIHRDASYRHPEIVQIRRTLHGGAPANAGDLAALVAYRLNEIARMIREANTNDWRQYWNEDRYRRPTEPKHEHSCRDALLSTLRERLPEGADAQPEGRYANDRRADIRIACGGHQVPVEIKKNSSRNLWSAMRSQLIDRYARNPTTNGYGIYLVFWFGENHTPQPPIGARPVSADELRERLESTLSADEARKISVAVIDVTPPP